MKAGRGKLAGLMALVLLVSMMMPGMSLAKPAPDKNAPFMIKVVDSATGRGIPLVELRTTNSISFYTDSAGVVAFDEPGLMNQRVFFHLASDGYEYPKDGFGYNGTAVDVTPGGSATLQMTRLNVAERLYRVTGEGIYRDSALLGLPAPIKEPLLNGQVMGQDSVQTIVYNNRLYWFWGDTDRPSYPLGNFRVTGATSKLPGQGGLDPDAGVDLQYITNDDGSVKSLVPPLPDGANIAWVFGLMTVKDDKGKERLLAPYSTHAPETRAYGILMFDDKKQQFEPVADFPSKDMNDWRHAGEDGLATYYEENGKGYWVFTEHQFPNLRVESKLSAVLDYTQWESFTCLAPGSRYDGANTKLDRDADGRLVWGWKKNTPMISQDQEKELIGLGLIKNDDPHYYQLKSAADGEEVQLAQSSVEWNDYLKQYVMIAQQKFGKTSLLGELWVAAAPSPQGPWTKAAKIVTHNNYTFYNPAQHAVFAKNGGRTIYFEATYTNTYTDHPPTPRYNYNQLMYKLDLADPRLGLVPAQDGANAKSSS
ncbi:hypothetical protein SAMN02799624_04280 [Paenibacillus sp. UNC496MF]|uniref:hypothetical protein n=1 Tax=Paenibacillus sp. UNC496MF TaxID=1502753 RepID=UPI0008E7B38C|nr:hypothetical protein [Paenibacillus sp. UNC496MF]SFJ36667.1 hypothetical protein SAMN02799624_04280 [Paenibacillus sp. UNC496MF]